MLEGDEIVRVAGTSHYQEALRPLSGRKGDEQVRVQRVALLVPEPDNPHDPNAIAVTIDGQLVGYLSRDENKRWLDVVSGTEVGAEAMIAGRAGVEVLGVFLRLPTPTEARAQIGIRQRG
ncbi:MAG TPA: HIRAN domain-containing protein [Thermoleophilaceae bacterium]|nr:HIRAN domain-containing protein [Thermoleophilaceae bacterium]